MQVHGFIHDMLDVKVLILYVTANALYPLSVQQIYELCYQDDGLSYFDVGMAVPQMVESGHLDEIEEGRFVITEKGREHEAITRDEVAYPVMQRARTAVEKFNRQTMRDSRLHTQILPRDSGECSVVLGLDDDKGSVLTIELLAPNQQFARSMTRIFREEADEIYQMLLGALLHEKEKEDL